MRVMHSEVTLVNRESLDLAMFDKMQPYSLQWLSAMCGARTLEAFRSWFALRVHDVVSTEGCIVFLEEPEHDVVVAHPFVLPNVRNKIALFRALLVQLGALFGKKTLLIRVTHRASQRVRELVEACGFRRSATAHVDAEGHMFEEWLKELGSG